MKQISSSAIRRRIEMGLACVVALLGIALFHLLGNTVEDVHSRSVFAWMVARWSDRISFGTDYSYGWLIPFGSAYVLWRRKDKVFQSETQVAPLGLTFVVLSLVLHWVGARIQQPRISLVAFISLIWSVVYYLKGWRVAKWIVFPCGFLVFCIPMNFLDAATFSLRLFATACSSALLNALGIATVRTGCLILSSAGGGFSFDVADPCSGLKSLLALTALIAIYANITQPTLIRQWILFLCAIPIAMAGNVVRVTTIALVAVVFGQEKALVVYHDFSGYIVFVADILFMIAAGNAIGRVPMLHRPHGGIAVQPAALPAPVGQPAASCRPALTPLASYFNVLGAMLLAGAALYFAVDVTLLDTPGVTMNLPKEVGEWSGKPLRFCHNKECGQYGAFVVDVGGQSQCPECGAALHTMSAVEREQLPGDTRFAKFVYTRPAHEPLFVSIVLSGKERSSIHRPQRCLVGQGAEILRSHVEPVRQESGRVVNVMVLDIVFHPLGRSDPSKEMHGYYVYWFVGRNRDTPYHLARMFWLGWDRLVQGRAHRWAYVIVQGPRKTDGAGSLDDILAFIADFYPLIRLGEGTGPAAEAGP